MATPEPAFYIPVHTRILRDRKWHLIQLGGINMQDLPFFVLVAVRGGELEAFTQAQNTPGFNPADYGVVLARGFTPEPPPLLKLEIIDRFESGQWLTEHA